MANYKVGTDIIEVARIKEAMQDTKFAQRVFTSNEIKYCESKNNTKYQSYAARFAGKEAVFKAISTFLNNKYDIDWKNVEIIDDKNGKPCVNLIDFKLENIEIDISLSHVKEMAMATAIAFDKENLDGTI